MEFPGKTKLHDTKPILFFVSRRKFFTQEMICGQTYGKCIWRHDIRISLEIIWFEFGLCLSSWIMYRVICVSVEDKEQHSVSVSGFLVCGKNLGDVVWCRINPNLYNYDIDLW